MSTMTIERRRKLEDHIMYAYLFKHAGIGHGSNGWDLIYGPVGDSPCIFAKPSLTGINGGFEINWFIPNEHGNESQSYKLYISAGTNTPYSDVFVAKRELTDAKDHIEEIDRCLNQANDIIDEWKSNTCCETPTEARKHIEELMQENASLQASVHNLEFTKAIGKEFSLKGCSARRAFWIRRNTDKYFKGVNHSLNRILFGDGSTTYGRRLKRIQKYLDKNEYSCVMDAIDQLEVETYALKEDIGEWVKATGCLNPDEAKKRIDGILDDLERDDDRICDLGIEIKKLQDRLKANKYNKLWITSNGMLFSESDITVDVLEAQVDRLNNEINDHVSHINELDARIKELSNVISEWQNATECKLPSMAKEKIEHYKRRLGNAVQAASCAAKHLDNITF